MVTDTELRERFRFMCAKANRNAVYALAMPHELMSIISAHDQQMKEKLVTEVQLELLDELQSKHQRKLTFNVNSKKPQIFRYVPLEAIRSKRKELKGVK